MAARYETIEKKYKMGGLDPIQTEILRNGKQIIFALLGVCYRLKNNDISEQDLLMSPKSVSTIPFVYGRILSNYNGDDLEKKLEKAVRDIVIIVADAYKTAYANKQTTSVSNFFKSDTRYYNEILPGFSQGLGFLAGEDLKQCMGILKR